MMVPKLQLIFVAIAILLASHTTLRCDAALPDDGKHELQGKVFCGYQGWFSAPKDGTDNGFDNYNYGGHFKPGVCVIDYWPDLSEFGKEEKYPTPFRHADGSVAHVFSSANSKTVERHFQWMKDYGIDGVFLQRFGWALKDPIVLGHRNQVLKNVRQSATRQKRQWALMYDLTSLQKGEIKKYVIPDIQRLVENGSLENDPSYLRYKGRPLIGIWGVGFNDNRAYSVSDCQELVDFLKDDSVCGGNSVMLGVPYNWRIQKHDAVSDPCFHELVLSADIISPWSVGRYKTVDEVREQVPRQIEQDLEWATRHKLGYLPVIFPGFSWRNLTIAEGDPKPLNQIPRVGGRLFWAQAVAIKNAGLDMAYVAMFDEMNEGTCVLKCTDNPPVGKSSFLSYDIDRLPSDHYLWLTGTIGQLMRGKIDSQQDMPIRQLHFEEK